MEVDLVYDWIGWLEDVRRVRGSTLDAYGSTLHKLAAYYDDKPSWADISPADVEQFMGRVRSHGRPGSAATQDRDRIAISMFFKYLQGRGKVVRNPVIDVGVPKVRNRAPRAVSDAVWKQLWSSDIPPEDRVWLGLAAFAGLRRRELATLSPASVDHQRGLLLGLQRKGGNEDAVEYEQMARILAESLPELLPDPDEWLQQVADLATQRRGEHCLITMDTPTTALTRKRLGLDHVDDPAPQVINRRLMTLLRRAGLDPHTFSPHALRHTCVTNLLRCGVPIEVVSDAVGHGNIDTTRRYVKSAGRLLDWRERLQKR